MRVVMYHYVRPLAADSWPRLKALDLGRFKAQLDHLARQGRFIGLKPLLDHAQGAGPPPPEDALLLTFDDGYRDHLRHVVPELRRRGLTGVFFPPVCAVAERTLLDVNKLHFILASGVDPVTLLAGVEAMASDQVCDFDRDGMRRDHWKPNRFDDVDTSYLKLLLQTLLPAAARAAIVDALFLAHVSADPRGFADELYLDQSDLGLMLDMGMHVGGHGAQHLRLSWLPAAEQQQEAQQSADFLRSLGVMDADLSFCYPFGDHDEASRAAVKATGFKLAFTTVPTPYRPGVDDCLAIPRLDTNDIAFD